MPEEQVDYITPLVSEFNTTLRDLEERQRLLKERVLLIGQNFIESKEGIEKNITELKLATEEMKQEIRKIKNAILGISEELEKRARKSELELLQKQAKMFQPLEFARLDDIKKLLKEK